MLFCPCTVGAQGGDGAAQKQAGEGPLRLRWGAGCGGEDDEMRPCEHCGRTYPHEHVRALRAGGDHGLRGSGSEQDD